jgi:two-component system, cell cycle response regulator DivK
MYAEYLRSKGYCTLQAANAHDGFRLSADLLPAVIVTDIKLPGQEDGLELTARLKGAADTRDAAIIVLSASAIEHYRQAASLAGCDRFIAKPCLPDDLESAVRALMPEVA